MFSTNWPRPGVFFLTFSGGEVFMRRDFFRILEYARSLLFCVRIKTTASMIREKEADRLRELGVDSVQVSIYSHRPEVHDAITKLPGSLKRSMAGTPFAARARRKDLARQRADAAEPAGLPWGGGAWQRNWGRLTTIDPTITPMMDGDRSILSLGISHTELREVFRTPELVGNVEEFCAPPPTVGDDDRDSLPCSASHTFCYISPYGDVYPCVQFPLPTGNVREQKFAGHLEVLAADERSPLHSRPRLAHLLELLTLGHLHPLPGAGLHGGQYAGALGTRIAKSPSPARASPLPTCWPRPPPA